MRKKVLVIGAVATAGIVGAISYIKNRIDKCSLDDCEGEDAANVEATSDTSVSCSCGGSCGAECCCGSGRSTADSYKDTVLYDGNDGTIKKISTKDLEAYVGKPQPALSRPLVLYYAACGKEEAQEISDDTNTVFVLCPNNGQFEVELNGKLRQYIGVCLPEEELFLWARANKKELYARPSGKMYSIGQDCNEKWYVQIELLRT